MLFKETNPLRAAEKYVGQVRILDAISKYRKAVDGDPANLTNMNILGDLCLRAGQTQVALKYFKKIAESYCKQEFWPRAIAMYKKLIKLDPTDPDLKMGLASLYLRNSFGGKARETYLLASDEYARSGQIRQAREAMERAVSIDPLNAPAHMRLGEICVQEGFDDQAHDAYIKAGILFLQSGAVEEALDASVKAVSINSESLQALETLTRVYVQTGQTDKAINLLCEALRKKTGDVNLLTVLGRTYLSAEMMDEAERTFLGLAVIDPLRSHYLLEVGEKFLELGDLDRAAEQTGICLDALIAKREEGKAIDLLRRVLDRDLNHVVSLKRLAQIFLRIGEDHDLIATLNSLVEAATRKGEYAEAIGALKELVRLEPYEPLHRHRLYNLGVQDVEEGNSYEVVPATGTLDYASAALRPDSSVEVPPVTMESESSSETSGGNADSDEKKPDTSCHLEATTFNPGSATLVKTPPPHVGSRTDVGTDTLRGELESIDFYIEQRYYEVARISLDRLRQYHGNLAEILARYKTLDENLNSQNQSVDSGRDRLITMSPAVGTQSFSDSLIMRKIYETKMFADEAEMARAVTTLRETINEYPDNIWLRTNLKRLYVLAGEVGMAANECLQIARIRESCKLKSRTEGSGAQLKGSVSSADEMALSLGRQSAYMVSDVTLNLPGEINRRRVERIALQAPALIAPPDKSWSEFTEVINVNQLGVMVRLAHLVEPETLLRVKLLIPSVLRPHDYKNRVYAASGIVCHITQGACAGIEFGAFEEA